MKKPDFRAVIIEASAGTGKTSRITDEFIRILNRKDPASTLHKILAMTFSEKAAIEMKMRILEGIYKEVYPELSEDAKINMENAMLKLRISTIHSFCNTVLKRFSFYTGIDPFFTVIDEIESDLLYHRAFYNFLNSKDSFHLLTELKDFKLNSLKELLFAVRKSHPYTTAGIPEGRFSKRILELSLHISEIHSNMKRELSMLDFNDLEILTYHLLTDHPDALTILEDFDEKNNYIFVDEFQDTNILQWNIVHKLVEDWLSGYGAKAEKGESYGLFLVGDRKQSIYKFRGAEGTVFDDARGTLRDYYSEEKLLKNYRSQPGILEFVNGLFGDTYPWNEQQLLAGLDVQAKNIIEINLLDDKQDVNAKEKEYKWVIGRILELLKIKEPVWDKKTEQFRPVEFRDIAILMRKRVGKNFLLFEQLLKESEIPFVILGGVGFYNEPEIVFLLSLVFALADPTDKVSLWNLHNSIYGISSEKIYRWREKISIEELTMVIESIMDEIGFWDGLSTQQKSNTEKFLMILQEMEHLPLYQTSRNLRTMALSYEEPKADIFSESQNAVRILTVHKAKGLEFPAVFLINLEDGKVDLRDRILYQKIRDKESPYKFLFSSEADDDYKNNFKNMLKEEEERVLYVALTRARQYLFISGVKNKRGSENCLWIRRILSFESAFPPASTASYIYTPSEKRMGEKEKPVSFQDRYFPVLTSYTHEKEQTSYHYKRTVAGDIAHKLLYEISEGLIKMEREDYEKRMCFYLGKTGLTDIQGMKDVLMTVYENIVKSPEIRSVVENLPKGEAFSELPFIVETEQDRIYTGNIDRVILKGSKNCWIYDYKLEGGSPERYKQQMVIYERAVRKIFPDRPSVKKYIIFLKPSKVLSV
jgi:ATP-dependent exoDNAse (exonuclease V) beta subunit